MYNFNRYKTKHESRLETIILMYPNLFKVKSLLGDYITLCGQQTDEDGLLATGSEILQLMEYGLLKPKQFYGVDSDKDTITLNAKSGIGHWVCSDILNYLENNIHSINPSIINLDTIYYCKQRSARLLSAVLLLLTDKVNTTNTCLVTLNVAVNNPYHRHNLTKQIIDKENMDFIQNLSNNLDYKIAVEEGGWKFLEKSFLYSSTGKTVMRTYCLYRNQI